VWDLCPRGPFFLRSYHTYGILRLDSLSFSSRLKKMPVCAFRLSSSSSFVEPEVFHRFSRLFLSLLEPKFSVKRFWTSPVLSP